MKISAELYQQMLDHARAEFPDECCGLIAAKDGEAVSFHPMLNARASGGSFLVHPYEQAMVLDDIFDRGLELGAIVHSHPTFAPTPSGVDTRYAKDLPGVMWIIMGRLKEWYKWNKRDENALDDDGEYEDSEPWNIHPDVWAWWIDANERIFTAELHIEGVTPN